MSPIHTTSGHAFLAPLWWYSDLCLCCGKTFEERRFAPASHVSPNVEMLMRDGMGERDARAEVEDVELGTMPAPRGLWDSGYNGGRKIRLADPTTTIEREPTVHEVPFVGWKPW
jgi:hypothetical protein